VARSNINLQDVGYFDFWLLGNQAGSPQVTGTPAGTYTVTVTGTSGTTSHTTTLMLTVN
jgi:PKD repeat protein